MEREFDDVMGLGSQEPAADESVQETPQVETPEEETPPAEPTSYDFETLEKRIEGEEEEEDVVAVTPDETEELETVEGEETPVESPQSELELLRAELAALKAEREAEKAKTAEEEPLAPDTSAVKQKDGVFDFVGEEDAIDIVSSSAGLNLLGTKITNTAVELAMRYVQPIITAEAARVNSIYSFAVEFYKAYPALRPHAKSVSELCDGIVTERPTITPTELFSLLADAAKKKHGIVDDLPQNQPKPPGFVTVKGSQQRTSASTIQQSLKEELAELQKGF